MSAGPCPARIGRLVQSADFERVLGKRSLISGPHFALHHLAGVPGARKRDRQGPATANLSTGRMNTPSPAVDGTSASLPGTQLVCGATGFPRLWLGIVIPKRHARRAVTRSLLKRQARAATQRQGARLPAGLWVVRLRAGFDRATYSSAASPALRRVARAELDGLMQRCATSVAASA